MGARLLQAEGFAEVSIRLFFRCVETMEKVMTAEVESALGRIAAGDAPSELESETLDFKEDARSVKESMTVVADAAICFANAQGGGLLAKTSAQQRGPGVEYGPGPNFPTR